MKRKKRDLILISIILILPLVLSLGFVHEDVNKIKKKEEMNILINQIYFLYEQGNYTETINQSQKLLGEYSLSDFPEEYALLQEQIGKSYYSLSKTGNTEGNLEKSIEAYEEALKGVNSNKFTMDRARVQTELGDSYKNMASLKEQTKEKSDYNWKAYFYYMSALKYYTEEKYPDQYENISIKIDEIESTPYKMSPGDPFKFGGIEVTVS